MLKYMWNTMSNTLDETQEKEMFDNNEYLFYTFMPDSNVKKNNLGYFLLNNSIETYSYITPTPYGEEEFEQFISYAFSFFEDRNKYFILKHPYNRNYQRNSKILRDLKFIPSFVDISVMKWQPNNNLNKPNPALEIEHISKKKIDKWVSIFFDSFQYPKNLLKYITRMVSMQIDNGVDFYVGYVSDKDVSCFCTLNYDKITGIYGVGTRNMFRRRGYATAMLSNYLNDQLTTKPNMTYCLQVHKNSGAEELYKKMGFETSYIQKRFDWNPLTLEV